MFSGGDGIIRELQFTRKLVVSILSERRAFQPYGLEGGDPGARGLNILHTIDGRRINMGGKNTVDVSPGDSLVIYTPGGGGYGDSKEAINEARDKEREYPQGSTPYLVSGSLNQYAIDQESV